MPTATITEHSPADIVRWLMVRAGVGSDPTTNDNPVANANWPVWVSKEPTIPDNLIKVSDTQGVDGSRSMVDGDQIAWNGFQVMVRAVDYPTGWQKVSAVRTAFLTDPNFQRTVVTVAGVRYAVQAIVKVGQVIPLGEEKPVSSRNLFTLNAMLSYRKL